MAQRRFVFMGIRLLCIVVVLGIIYRDFLHGEYGILLSDVGLVGVLAFYQYANMQGRKLADKNMRDVGLNPDRDEAQPARKAIDNRS
ncbi:MAG TPA: hypothetical protein VH117_03775 [Edaphobacter sp.]|jgi:hypothetical protein|nr:hypothetical protein [Edaphobacter sp.]